MAGAEYYKACMRVILVVDCNLFGHRLFRLCSGAYFYVRGLRLVGLSASEFDSLSIVQSARRTSRVKLVGFPKGRSETLNMPNERRSMGYAFRSSRHFDHARCHSEVLEQVISGL